MKKYLVLSLFFLATTASASSDCGTITGPEDLNNGAPLTTVPIENCTDPFGVTFVPSNPYTLHINDTVVANNGTYNLDEEGETNLRITGQSHQSDYFSFLFKHTDDGYEYIDQSIPEPTHSDEVAYINTYFQTESERTRYREILSVQQSGGDTEPFFYNEAAGGDILDIDTGEYVSDRFSDFLNSFYDYYYNQLPPPLNPGTYTLVFKEYELILNQHSFLQKLAKAIIPKAEASCDYCTPPYIYTITFTILPYEPDPIGASSVLFLPGIQASRLYKEGVLGTEDQLWEPNINSDIRQLEMSEDGFSINNVYTKDVVSEIFGISNVYKTFLDLLEELKEEEIIKDYSPFPYDWRYSVWDLLVSGTVYDTGIKSVISEIERLADESYTGQVTIIAHSNGGLFTKAIMIELERLGEEDLIDKVVFVGTPQLGTPKAIASILHGYGQQYAGGLISGDETARDVIKNMPGTYALLPSEKYFEVTNETVVSNDDSEATEYLNEYNNISNFQLLQDFMIDSKGARTDYSGINIPNISNNELLIQARDLHRKLDNWVSTSSLQVFEIVGTGIPTIKSFEYRQFPCSIYSTGLPCAFGNYAKPYPTFTSYGDETVVATSASAYPGDKFTAYVDLEKENRQFATFDKKHANITESETVQEYITSIIKFGYQNDTLNIPVNYTEVERRYTITGVHSPVNIILVDEGGKKTGVENGQNFNEILGAQYIELAGSRYVIVPEGNYKVLLSGYATGTFSVTVSTLNGDTNNLTGAFFGASTTPQMVGEFIIENENISQISIDLDGDKENDFYINLETGITTPVKNEIKVAVNGKSGGSRVAKLPIPQVAGVSLSPDDVYYQKVYELLVLIKLYVDYMHENK